MQLPALLVHGAWIWKLGVPALVAMTLAVGYVWRRHRGKRPLLVGPRALAILGVALAWLGITMLVGRAAAKRVAARAEVTPALLIAGAMPGSRGDALRAVEAGFRDGKIERGDAADAMHVAIAQLLGDPCLAAEARLRRIPEVRVALRPCDDPQREALALTYEGRFAAAHVVGGGNHPIAAISAGNWVASAQLAEARGDPCLAMLFRFCGGDAGAFATITPASNLRCRLFNAFAVGTELPADLPSDPELAALARPLAWMTGASMGVVERDGIDAIAFGIEDAFWLSSVRMAPRPFRNAQLDVIRGDFASARAEVVRIEISDEEAARTSLVHSLAIMIALHAGEPLPETGTQPIHPGIARLVAARRGEPIGDAEIAGLDPACDATFRAAFALAQGGEGRELARVLRRCALGWRAVPQLVLAVAPLVVRHRAELAEAVRHLRSASTYTSMFHALDDLVLYRDLSRIVGDRREAARWTAAVERHVAARMDAKRAVALYLWNH